MNLTYGEHRASDQNVEHYMPPLEKLPPLKPRRSLRWAWNLLRQAIVFVVGLAGFVCGVLAAGWA